MAAARGRRGATAVPGDAIEPLGSVRRSQLVSSFGIGAIVDLEKGSFMPMGLEDWERATGLPSLHIGEPRLQGMLGVSHFRLGPVKEDIPGTRQVRARSHGTRRTLPRMARVSALPPDRQAGRPIRAGRRRRAPEVPRARGPRPHDAGCVSCWPAGAATWRTSLGRGGRIATDPGAPATPRAFTWVPTAVRRRCRISMFNATGAARRNIR